MVRHDNRTEKFKSIWTVKTQTTLSFLTLMLALNVMDPVSQNEARVDQGVSACVGCGLGGCRGFNALLKENY